MFDLFRKAEQLHQDILVRAANDRLVDHEERLLWSYLQHQPVAGEISVQVPRHAEQSARRAHVQVRFAPVVIRPPAQRKKENLASMHLWAVLAQEVDAPSDVEAINWLLLTTVVVEMFDQACPCIAWYTCRWVIETYHKLLKSGCRVEERQFGDADNLQPYLALD